MKQNEYIKFGVIWGITSGLLYFLFPEGFDVQHTQSMTLTFIPNWLKILMLLPIYLTTFLSVFGWYNTEPEAIFIIAPIYIVISGFIGGAIGYVVYLFSKGD